MGARMLQDVRQDLTDVVQVCEGKKKQTNDLRSLINDMVKGESAERPLTLQMCVCWVTDARWCVRRYPAPQLVPLHRPGGPDRHPMGGRLQRAHQAAAADLAGSGQRGG